jgi:NifU-like protein involved in Fe-S cluster formation
MTSLEDLYTNRILELAANIPVAPRLVEPQSTITLQSKLCGSTITIDMDVTDGRVSRYGHVVKACMLGQAAASIMAEHVVGASAEELRALAEGMRRMLKQGGPPPVDVGADGRWADVAVLEPIRDYKARHTSTLLAFEAVEKALEQLAPGTSQSAAAVA